MEPESSSYRLERKFLVQSVEVESILHLLKRHQAMFTEIYSSRFINNIYFDNDKLECYHSNAEGNENRFKVRLRWYGECSNSPRASLELKFKKGLAGFKDNYQIPLILKGDFPDTDEINQAISLANLPKLLRDRLHQFYPIITNRYLRRYFVSYDKRFRVTVDSELEFYSKTSFLKCHMRPFFRKKDIIVELKYSHVDEKDSNEISQKFPFRMTKSSKYVEGISQLMMGKLL